MNMYVPNCIKNPQMYFLICRSYDKNESSCYCAQTSSEHEVKEEIINNRELFQDLYFKDINQHDLKEDWDAFSGMRILDCMNWKNNPMWVCKTYNVSRTKTMCICFNNPSPRTEDIPAITILKTENLYKNLNNYFNTTEHFPSTKLHVPKTSSRMTSSKIDPNQVKKSITSDIIDQDREKFTNINDKHIYANVIFFLTFFLIALLCMKLHNLFYKKKINILSKKQKCILKTI